MFRSLRWRLSSDLSRFTNRTLPCSTLNMSVSPASTAKAIVIATYDLPLPGGPNKIEPPPLIRNGSIRNEGGVLSVSGTRKDAFCVPTCSLYPCKQKRSNSCLSSPLSRVSLTNGGSILNALFTKRTRSSSLSMLSTV